MKTLLSLIFLLLTPPAHAADLAKEMAARMMRVPEFEFVRAEAERLGVRVYLFGGTAASYAHYVREDLLREAGDERYPKLFYDYDYTNIFRSTQDLDLVIDGSPAQAEQLEKVLKEKYPHFLGDKAAKWEVRPLRFDRGEKEAILGNPNFQNQHTDSHSTGAVELTATPAGESPVRDVRDWNSPKPKFLTDVEKKELHFYFSPLHETTNRFRAGKNPPFVAAIRYLTKAFQYDLATPAEDMANVRKALATFQPDQLKDPYVLDWVEKNGKKLFQHSVNLERSWDTLESLGLREKLIALKNDASVQGTLAWWMSKAPLRSRPLGAGNGKTAREIAAERGLKELVIAHEANNFLSYESITRSRAGELNALISRKEGVGEFAHFGEGFYAMIGRKGARNTGFTIRSVIKPEAREGSDFILFDKVNMVTLQNKLAAKTIPESLEISVPEYFHQLATDPNFKPDDKALFEKFKRKVNQLSKLTDDDEKQILASVRGALQKRNLDFSDRKRQEAVLKEWFSLKASVKYPELLGELEALADRRISVMAEAVFSQAHWRPLVSLDKLISEVPAEDYTSRRAILDRILADPAFASRADLVDHFLDMNAEATDRGLVAGVLGQSHWQKDPRWEGWVEKIIARGHVNKDIIEHLLGTPPLTEFKMKWIRHFVTTNPESIANKVLSQPWFANHPDAASIIQSAIEDGKCDSNLVAHVMVLPQWKDRGDWLDTLLSRPESMLHASAHLLTLPQWQTEPARMEKIIEYLAANPEDRSTRQVFFGAGINGDSMGIAHEGWAKYPQLMEKVIRSEKFSQFQVDEVLKLPHWQNQPELRALVGKGKITYSTLADIFRKGKTLLPPPSPLLEAGCGVKFHQLAP